MSGRGRPGGGQRRGVKVPVPVQPTTNIAAVFQYVAGDPKPHLLRLGADVFTTPHTPTRGVGTPTWWTTKLVVDALVESGCLAPLPDRQPGFGYELTDKARKMVEVYGG